MDEAKPTTLRDLRKGKCMTLVQLSRASGVPNGNLSRIERGQEGASMERICAIAKALEVEPGRVFEAILAVSRGLSGAAANEPAMRQAA